MNQYIYTVQATRLAMLSDTATAVENVTLADHAAYIERLVTEGSGIFAGATDLKDSRHFGMVIFQAEDDDSAKAIMANDPAVKERVMRGCLYPFRLSLWNQAAMTLADTQQHYFYKIQPVRPAMIAEGPTEQEGQTMGAHFNYLKQLTDEGIFALAGPTLVTDNSNFGVGLLRADNIEAAWDLSRNDPAVINRVMRLDILPFNVAFVTDSL